MDTPSEGDSILRETSERILGTRIYELRLGDEPVSLVSDLHLRPEEGDKLAALDRLLEALPEGSVLIVLGDLFDFWVGYKQGHIPAWRDLLDRFAGLSQRGIRSFFLWGNRDYQLDARFEAQVQGVVVPGGLRLLRPSGTTLLCLHGDELCLNDASYQKAKRRLRSWPLRFLARHLPISLGLRAASQARTKSQAVISGTSPENLKPSSRALQAVHDAGASQLLFGHIHIAGCGPLCDASSAGSYHVLPAFEPEDPGSASFDDQGGLTLLRDGKRISWPGPVELSP